MAGLSDKYNLASALNLLKAINQCEVFVGGRWLPVADIPISAAFAQYSAWHLFQQSLLYEGIRGLFRKQAAVSRLRRAWSGFLQGLSRLGIVGVSLIGVVVLLFARRRVVLYTIDKVSNSTLRCDFRMEGIYRHLHESKVRYVEFVHTPGGRNWVRNWFIRRRPVIYLEAIDYLYAWIHPFSRPTHPRIRGQFAPMDLERIEHLVGTYLSRIPSVDFKARWLCRLLRWGGTRLVLSIDDPRYYHELILACRSQGIRFAAFQHGHFTKYHVGWLRFAHSSLKTTVPNTLVLWSEYWKNVLLDLGTYFESSALFVGGKPYGRPTKPRPRLAVTPGTSPIILIPYENEAPKDSMRALIQKLREFGLEVVFKARPDVAVTTQLAEYGLTPGNRLRVVTNLDEEPRIDLVIGTYSTLLYQMVEEEVPVAVLNSTIDLGEGLVKNGLAMGLNLETLSLDRILELCNLPASTLAERRSRLVGQGIVDFDRTLSGILHSGDPKVDGALKPLF